VSGGGLGVEVCAGSWRVARPNSSAVSEIPHLESEMWGTPVFPGELRLGWMWRRRSFDSAALGAG
jgi:hypothetical protein